jgi:hypothetical protein
MRHEEFKRCVSDARLSSLERLLKKTTDEKPTDEEFIKIHQWIKACNAALLPLIQTCEVTLRNAIHGSLKGKHGDKWYGSPRYKSFKAYEPSKTVVDFKEKISSANLKASNSKQTVVPDRVISSADFYTWELILDEEFFDASDSDFLWPHNLDKLFTGIPATEAKTKKQLNYSQQKIQSIRLVRNRIAHNETPWRRNRVEKSRSVGQARSEAFKQMNKCITNCEEIISMISVDKLEIINEFDWISNAKKTCSINGFQEMVLS